MRVIFLFPTECRQDPLKEVADVSYKFVERIASSCVLDPDGKLDELDDELL